MKRRNIIGCLAMIGLLTACSAKPVSEQSNDFTVDGGSGHITAEITDLLKVDAWVTAPEKETYPVYLADFEPEEILTQEEIVEILYQSDPEDLQGFSEGYAFAATNPGIEGGIINPARKGYYYFNKTKARVDYPNIFIGNGGDTIYRYRTAFSFDTSKELDGLTRKDAIRAAKDLFEKLGFDTEDEPRFCHAITWEQLDEYVGTDECIDLNTRPDIRYEKSEENSCYYMLWRNVIDDVPVADASFSDIFNTHSQYAQGSYVFVVVGEDASIYGLETFASYHPREVLEEGTINVRTENIPELIAEYYQDTILTEGMIVESIEFCYIPDQFRFGPDEFRMIPGYQICVLSNDGNATVLYINALTGDVF